MRLDSPSSRRFSETYSTSKCNELDGSGEDDDNDYDLNPAMIGDAAA